MTAKPRNFQAIVTKFIPATNTKLARVKATADAGSVTLPWYTDACDNFEDRHHVAAKMLAARFNWTGRYYVGGLPGGKGNVYVNADYPQGAPDKPIPVFEL